MDYYGYFPTFDFLGIETYIVATLIGFIAIFFIFWFNHKYNIATKNKQKDLDSTDKMTLFIATLVFIGIMLFGITIIIGNSSTLYSVPKFLEYRLVEEVNKTIPPNIVETFKFHHTSFTLWTLFSFIYILALMFSLDIFNIFTFSIKEKQKEDIKKKKKNVKKIKKSSGGK